MTMIECHICHKADLPQNLKRVKPSNGEAAHAHPKCVERHNKEAKRGLRSLDASLLADCIFDHDRDATDSYVVEGSCGTAGIRIAPKHI